MTKISITTTRISRIRANISAAGYTLLIASTGFVVNASLYRDPGYDPFKDFLPITELGSSPNVILPVPRGDKGVTRLPWPARSQP